MTELSAPHPHAVRFAERVFAHDVVQKILVVVDPTARKHPCIGKAARLAASFGSTIELFTCDREMQIPDSWAGGTTSLQYRQYMREQRIAMLEQENWEFEQAEKERELEDLYERVGGEMRHDLYKCGFYDVNPLAGYARTNPTALRDQREQAKRKAKP